MIRRTYVATMRKSGYAIEEHTPTGDLRVIATDLGRHQADAMIRMIDDAIDRFAQDNRLTRVRAKGRPPATLAARFR